MSSQQDLLTNLQSVLYELKSSTFASNNKSVSSTSSTPIKSLINGLIRANFNVVTLLRNFSETSQQDMELTAVKKKSKFQKPAEKKPISTKLLSNDKIIPKLKQQLLDLKKTTEKLFTEYFQNMKINSEPQLSQSFYLILAKSYCLMIVLKLQLQIDENDMPSVQEEMYRLQYLLNLSSKKQTTNISGISLPSKLIKLCIRQLLNLDSINQYEFYNINSNQEFKFDEKTQQKFLHILSVIKLSSHLKLFAFQKKSIEEIRVIQKIYQEGKDSLLRLENLNENRSRRQSSSKKVLELKLSCMEMKIRQIRLYLTWIESNWIQFLRQKISKKSEINQFKQLPIQMLTVYQLFFIIHKLSEFQQQYVKKQDLKKFQYQIKGEVLRNAQQIKLRIKKCLENSFQTSKDKIMSQRDKIHSVLQWVLIQIQVHMKSCESNCNKLTLQKLDNLIKNTQLISLINQFQIKPKTESVMKTLQNQISESKIKQEKQLRKAEHQKKSIIQGSNKQVNIFKTFENQSQKESLNPSKKSSKNILQKSTSLLSVASFAQQNTLSFCTKGQYLTKFNYNNDSSAKKFVQLSTKLNAIRWADNKEEISHDASQQNFNKIFGLVYGDVTSKMLYHCEDSKYSSHKIESWKCFSLICKNRTIDFCCEQNQVQVFFWLNGLAFYLQEKKGIKCNFSYGKMLWKKMLMRLRDRFLVNKNQQKKKDKKRFYLGKYNARAIINFGKYFGNLEKSNNTN